MKDYYTTNSHYFTFVPFELGRERAEQMVVGVSQPPHSADVANGSRTSTTVARTMFPIQITELSIIKHMSYLRADMPGMNCRAFPFRARLDLCALPFEWK